MNIQAVLGRICMERMTLVYLKFPSFPLMCLVPLFAFYKDVILAP